MERQSVHLSCAAIDEQGTEIVGRGVLDSSSLNLLNVAEYQREILPERRINALMAALQKGGVPDIQLGCRGGNFIEKDGGNLYIQDPVYIIDGLQRRTAALKLLEKGIVPRLGAVVSFNTTEELERERFRVLNVTRVKLSPNVLLRNQRHESEAVRSLFQLCSMSQFVLYRRVCWQQRMKREELVTAMMIVQATAFLHYRFVPRIVERSLIRSVRALDGAYGKIGRAALMTNVREFWTVFDNCFNIHEVIYKDASCVLRGGFIFALAQMFSQYEDFWHDTEFSVPADLQKKLASFPVNEPSVRVLATATGTGITHLRNLMVEHLNSGKRTKRLRPFREADQYEEETALEAVPA